MIQTEKEFKVFILATLRDIIKHDQITLEFHILMAQKAIDDASHQTYHSVEDYNKEDAKFKRSMTSLQEKKDKYNERLADITSMLAGLDLDGVEA